MLNNVKKVSNHGLLVKTYNDKRIYRDISLYLQDWAEIAIIKVYITKEARLLYRASIEEEKNEELLFVAGHNSRRGEEII